MNRILAVLSLSFLYLFNVLEAAPTIDQFHIFTVASQRTNGLIQLLESCKYRNIEIDILGLGEPYPITGHGQKLVYLKEYIQDLPDEDVVMYIDGYDTLVLASKEDILSKFLDKKKACIFGSGIHHWGYPKLVSKFPKSPTRFAYLNAGTFIGYVAFLKKMLNAIGTFELETSDQGLIAPFYLEHTKEMILDHHCQLFIPLQGVKESEILCDPVEKTMKCLITDTKPCIIHGNGHGRSLYQTVFNELFLTNKPSEDEEQIIESRVVKKPPKVKNKKKPVKKVDRKKPINKPKKKKIRKPL